MPSKTPQFDVKIDAILNSTSAGPRTCVISGESWELTNEEIAQYRRFNVPPSNYSQLTRLRLLTSFFVGYQWWNNKDAKTGKTLITSSHPASGVKVLSDESWFNEDFSSIIREDDPSRSVFETIRELEREIPFTAFRNSFPAINSISTISLGDENSYFMNACRAKNSFFSVNALDTEHSAEVYQAQNVIDSYNVIFSDRIFNCRYIQQSRDCLNSQFLFDCRNCEDCFMATNKRNKKFIFKNEQLTETEYRERMSKMDMTCRSTTDQLKQEFFAMITREAIWPENFNEQTTDSTGEYLTRTTNCRFCYFNKDCKDNFWCGYGNLYGSEGNAFTAGWFTSNNSYCSMTGSRSSNILFSGFSVQCQNLEYCLHCYNCENCFGCVGLQRKQYCIFNKQYSEAEYWIKLDEIKCRMLDNGEYGEFFPANFSPTRFLDSGAALFYLADETDAKKFSADDYAPESNGAAGETAVPVSELLQTDIIPDCLSDMKLDELIGKAVYDKNLKRRYSLLPQELSFYREMKIAPPNQHFIGRVRDLSFRTNSGVFQKSFCAQCGKEVLTTLNKQFPNRKIFCNEHYINYIEMNG